MRILMMTNTFTPHVGGVARSVESFIAEFRKLGHDVLTVAPVFEGMPEREHGVVRIPAIQNFNGSDFSVRLPIPGMVSSEIEKFRPQIIHTHHPFLLGDTALRVAAMRGLPLVFTHHTMYEQYTHYVPLDSPALKRFVIKLTTGYANLCDHVIAPSESVADVLRERGVETPIEVIPSGVRIERFARGDRSSARKKFGIPSKVFTVGHLGRLAPEKNLEFLIQAVGAFLWRNPQAHFLVVGRGPADVEMRGFFEREGMADRVHFGGVLQGKELIDAYHAMDVFAFASKSETQGIVLVEAMAAGLPVVALDAPGAREVVRDEVNGHLIFGDSIFDFAWSIQRVAGMSPARMRGMKSEARATARSFSLRRCANKALKLYQSLHTPGAARKLSKQDEFWSSTLRLIRVQWDHLQNLADAAGAAFLSGEPKGDDLK